MVRSWMMQGRVDRDYRMFIANPVVLGCTRNQ